MPYFRTDIIFYITWNSITNIININGMDFSCVFTTPITNLDYDRRRAFQFIFLLLF